MQRGLFVFIIGSLGTIGVSQETLDLRTAIDLAKKRNGTIQSARFNVYAAAERVNQQNSAFLPTLDGTYIYNSNQQQFSNTGFLQTEGGRTQLTFNYRILDLGERNFRYRASVRSLESQQLDALQTLRSTLFNVIQQYYETLRAQELQRVAEEQVSRTELILKQTIRRIELRDDAPKNRFQAEADNLNAIVSALTAKNQTTNNAASLKAIVGLDADRPIPVLEKPPLDTDTQITDSLPNLIAEGIRNRADLLSTRKSIESARLQKKVSERDAGISGVVDFSYGEQLSPDSLQNRSLSLTLSYPIFDGGRRRAVVREQQNQIRSREESLKQSERSVRAEIESAFKETEQNAERLNAATAALSAAQKNYDAAVDSQKLGAANLIEVSTARVSLVTAQSNLIQAQYDFAISKMRLQLVVGRPMPGE